MIALTEEKSFALGMKTNPDQRKSDFELALHLKALMMMPCYRGQNEIPNASQNKCPTSNFDLGCGIGGGGGE